MSKELRTYKSFGKMLEQVRLSAGIKHQAELAALVRVTQQTVSRWENGLSRPREKQLQSIVHVLNIDEPAELFAAAGYSRSAIEPMNLAVLTLDQPFPVDALTPDSFERFCLYFLEKYFPDASVHRLGGVGHTQDGADVEVTLPDGKRYSFQCKRTSEFGPAKVRAAVREHKRKAAKKILLLTRVASPQARDTVAKYCGWEIWDKEDISVRIRKLAKDEQRQLVDVFFRGQRLALLGEPESSPWQTPEYFFQPFMGERGAFRHTWPLIGREKETQTIVDALSDDTIKVVLLEAAGGGGKSRILRQAISKFQHHGTLVRFLSPTSDITDKSLEELGTTRKILVVDDAHDRNDLPLLFQYTARTENRATLLLALRPYAVEYLKAQAGTLSLSGESIREIKLKSPTLGEATELAKRVLTELGGPMDAAKSIAQATRDCPLATVMTAQIVAKEPFHFELAKNDDSFRSTLFGKFQDVITGDIGDKSDAEPIRKLLRVLAVLQPFHPEDPVIARTVAAVEGLAVPQVNCLMRLLSDAGVLFKRGGLYRLSPDLLADFIIEKACVGPAGQSTGYAEQILDKISTAHLKRLLLNLSRLDWRRNQGDPDSSPLMNEIWTRLRHERYADAVAEVAYFQPTRALEYATYLMRTGIYPADLPDLLKYASYSMKCTPRALELLWQLVVGHEESHYAERAIKVLADLCAVEPNKPFSFIKLVVEFGLSLLRKDESWGGKFTPLQILEGILRTNRETCVQDGRQVRINRYSVSLAFAGPLRQLVVDGVVKLLEHPKLEVALTAARFLKKALQYPMYGGSREEWTHEFVVTLEKIEKAITKASLNHLIVIELARAVKWLALYANDATSPPAKRILALVPNSLEARTTLALVDEYGEIFERMDDLEKCEREHITRLQTLTKDLTEAFPDACNLYAYVQARVQHIKDYCRDEKGATLGLFSHLLHASPSLVELTINEALAHPDAVEQGYGAAALAVKLSKNRAGGFESANRFLQSTSRDLHIAVSRAYRTIDPTTFGLEDIGIVRRLLASPDSSVLDNALWIVRGIAAKEPAFALDLLRVVDFDNSQERAESVLSLFGQSIPLEAQSDQTIQAFLQKLKTVPELEGHWVETFLAHASEHYPDYTADFFMKRVEHSADQKDWSFRPCNHRPFTMTPLRFREAKEFGDILRRVVYWMQSRSFEDYMFIHNACRLFEAMFSTGDQRVLSFLSDWIVVASQGELRIISAILENAEPEFVFKHRNLIVRLLEKAESFGPDLVREIRSMMHNVAVCGTRSGVPGEPFPRDIKMKQEAEKVLAEMPRFSSAYDLFDSIRKHADREIEQCQQEEESFED